MLLKAETIAKSFGRQAVLIDASLSLGAGQSVALIGDSGSGKSTFIHILAGLDTPDAGSVSLDGQAYGRLGEAACARLRREKIGIIFQHYNLIPSLTARANLAFQARLAGRHDEGFARQLADRLGILDHLHKFPEELSGGQQQRVAIGRALAGRPALILADEPTGNLDEATAEATLDVLLDLVADAGAGLVMATHSTARADRLGRVARLTGGRLS